MSNTTLTPELKKLLSRCTCTASSVTLPEQLDPATYRKINQVLANAGGRWDKKAKAHIFPGNPKSMLAQAIETKKSIDPQQARQSFFTPKNVAQKLAALAKVKGKSVLDPSAGRGAIALACQAAGAKSVHCFELDPTDAKYLQEELCFFTGHADFLTVPTGSKHFDCVVMNPPFTKNQDVFHVARAWEWLNPNGTLVAIMANSPQRGSFQKLIEDKVHKIEELPAGTFKDSGTMVKALIVTLRKQKPPARSTKAQPASPTELPPVEYEHPDTIIRKIKRELLNAVIIIDDLQKDLRAPKKPSEEPVTTQLAHAGV
jgi:predicted RNA methylase